MQEFQFDPRKKGRAYSKGNRQKVALIAALAVPADLYIFDEPTSGLDPLMEVVFRREIARMQDAGATVLLSSHILSEVELLCDRVSIIRAGKVVESGTLAELRHLTRTEVSFEATEAGAAGADPGRARRVVRGGSRALHRRQRRGGRGPSGARPARRHGPAHRSRPRSRSSSCATTATTCRQVRRTPASTPGRGAIAGRRPGDERLRHPAAAADAPRLLAAADVDRRHGAARVRHLRRRLATRTAPSRIAQALLATAIANPVILLFRGLPSGADEGAFMLFLIFPFLAMLAAFMSTFLAVRHTRMDEELGRAELVAATPAGRTLPLVATRGPRHPRERRARAAHRPRAAGHGPRGAGLVRRGLRRRRRRSRRSSGSGSCPGSSCAPRAARTRSPSGCCSLTFLIGGIGNALGTPSDDLQRIESSWLTWLSPFGWGENSRPFADDNVWPLLLCVAFGLVLAGAVIRPAGLARPRARASSPNGAGGRMRRRPSAGPDGARLAPDLRLRSSAGRSEGCSPGSWRRASPASWATSSRSCPRCRRSSPRSARTAASSRAPW